ncbi:MAG: ATP-binding protein [Bacteroidales bacterium]|jgi:serine/threonine-protein kinase RsbW|nr:ATP-binding protein [Bacteroidales bacterium]
MESITINSDVENLKVVETVVDTLSKKLGIPDEVYGKILISTVEAVNNAILHGNKGDSRKMVKVDFTADGNFFNVTVTDEGEGFEYTNLPDPTDPKNIENLHGRGVFLMRNLSDEIEFNESGNEVKMLFRY